MIRKLETYVILGTTTEAVHKYMNTAMNLFSILRKSKPKYEDGVRHKVYENRQFSFKGFSYFNMNILT